MLFSDLEEIVGGAIQIRLDFEIAKFSTDTRSLTGNSNEVFVAMKGPNRDGHDFIASAIKKGVKNFIVETNLATREVNVLQVENSVASFQQIASNHRKKFAYPIIGITGSNGKTTVKEWLSTILAKKFYIVKSPKSYNSQIGVPISVLEMRTNHEMGIFEAGISASTEMDRLAAIIQPDMGIFTTLGEAHDNGFISREKKLKEKMSLFSSSKKVICRSDVSWFPEIKKILLGPKIISWSLAGNAIYSVSWNTSTITINDYSFETKFGNEAALENATHCCVTALELGLSRQEIQHGLDGMHAVPMRLELKKGVNGCYILDDSYNNDLAGLKVAMDYMDSQKQNVGKTLVLSDILHSGKPDPELYAEVSALIRQKKFNRFIGVGGKIVSHQKLFKLSGSFYRSTEELLEKFPDFSNEMILVKGARDFQLERIVKALEEKSHGTILEVNFEALQHNLNQYKQLLKPETKVMVMVKANAYGSGLLEVANFLQHQQVDQLGVAYVDEAIQLRKNGVTLPIMIMNPHVESFVYFEKYGLQPEIFSLTHLKRFINDSKNLVPIHLKIDTGMHRLGFSDKEIFPLLQALGANKDIKVASIFTHFSRADSEENDIFTQQQASTFNMIYDQISTTLGYAPAKHACNSSATVRWPQYHFDMVRLGIGLHGFDPTGKLALRFLGKLKTVISQIHSLKKGEAVGYAGRGKLSRDSEIAILPIGYEDGYLRVFGNGQSNVSINNQLCPTIGDICMDMTMIDVTDTDVKEGSEVIVFGNNPTIADLARSAKTIPYEVLTNVSNRVKRVFISE